VLSIAKLLILPISHHEFIQNLFFQQLNYQKWGHVSWFHFGRVLVSWPYFWGGKSYTSHVIGISLFFFSFRAPHVLWKILIVQRRKWYLPTYIYLPIDVTSEVDLDVFIKGGVRVTYTQVRQIICLVGACTLIRLPFLVDFLVPWRTEDIIGNDDSALTLTCDRFLLKITIMIFLPHSMVLARCRRLQDIPVTRYMRTTL